MSPGEHRVALQHARYIRPSLRRPAGHRRAPVPRRRPLPGDGLCDTRHDHRAVHQFDPGQMWDLIRAREDHALAVVPAILNFMYVHPRRLTTDTSLLRWIACGAAPVPVSLIQAYAAMGIEVRQILRPHRDPQRHLCDQRGGRPAQGRFHWTAILRYRCARGGQGRRGRTARHPGEVITRGPHLFSGYGTSPRATREAIRDGWFYTGDIAEVDADGFIYIKDRSKDMIISGGENVYPAEVEDALLAHAGVRDVGVIGQPSARWARAPAAVM